MTQIDQAQNIMYIAHSTFFLSFFATISVFAIDMARFKKWSISTLNFSLASIVGIVIGSLAMEFFPKEYAAIDITVSAVLTSVISGLLAIKLQTLDQPVPRKSRGEHSR